MKCLKKVTGFEYCMELGQRIKVESTIMTQVMSDADHVLREMRYKPRLASTGPNGAKHGHSKNHSI